MLKKAITVSGINGLVLTKLDVLDSFKDIKICTSYKINNQIVLDYPSNLSNQQNIIPIYETLQGWEEKTIGVTKFENLPLNAQNYVKRIETLVDCDVDIISTGPERDENIILNEIFN
jgi:adenylosuccinate synthase